MLYALNCRTYTIIVIHLFFLELRLVNLLKCHNDRGSNGNCPMYSWNNDNYAFKS